MTTTLFTVSEVKLMQDALNKLEGELGQASLGMNLMAMMRSRSEQEYKQRQAEMQEHLDGKRVEDNELKLRIAQLRCKLDAVVAEARPMHEVDPLHQGIDPAGRGDARPLRRP